MTTVVTAVEIPVGPYKKVVIKVVKGPSSYASGGFDVTISELMRAESAAAIADGGYKAEVVSINFSILF